MDRQYRYEPLCADKCHIRLLRFIQENDHQDQPMLKFALESISLDSSVIPRFHALSYFLGDPNTTSTVEVNGKPLQVPRNTEAALRALLCHRRALRARSDSDTTEQVLPYVWIDAVCINQLDASERSKQVALMRSIYSTAEQVVIWLGDADDRAAEAAVLKIHVLFEICMGRFNGESLAESFPSGSASHFDWKSILPLYASPWWNRIWTVQEAHLARKATCLLGRCATPLYELTLTAYAVSQAQYYHAPMMKQELAGGLELATARVKLHKRIGPFDSQPLEITKLLQGFNASDPRDMVYGIMVLIQGPPWQPCSFGKLPVDYTIPLQELFAKASMAFIEDSDNLEIFQLAAVQSHISTPDGLPSWALNLASFSDTAPTARPIRPQLYTNCFRQTTYNQRPGFELNVDWTAISVAGYLFDRVETTISFEGVLPDGRAAPFWSKLDEVRLAMKEKFFQQSKCRLQAGNNISRDTAAVKSRDLDSGDNSSTETESVETRSIKRTFASNLIRRLRRSLRVVEQHFAREQAAQYSAARVGGKYYNSPGVLAEAVAYTLVAAIYVRHESSAARYATVIKGELGDFETSIRGSAWTVSKNLRDIFRDTKAMQRAFFVTQQGCLGMALPKTRTGDAVCLLRGGRVPFILRRDQNQEHWNLVSDAYVHGVEECSKGSEYVKRWKLSQPEEKFVLK